MDDVFDDVVDDIVDDDGDDDSDDVFDDVVDDGGGDDHEHFAKYLGHSSYKSPRPPPAVVYFFQAGVLLG